MALASQSGRRKRRNRHLALEHSKEVAPHFTLSIKVLRPERLSAGIR